MPFLTPGSRMSMGLRASPVLGPPSPPQSGCESVTPRSQAYPDTPPVLDAELSDMVPFSASFSAFLDFNTQDATLQSATITDNAPVPVKDVKRLSRQVEASYYVEQLTNIRDIDSEWEDDEVEEVMIISPKPKTQTAPNGSPLAHVLPTPPFSPSVEHPEPVVPQESYTILRTLHRTQTSNLSLAVSSGCATSTKKARLRHALYAIRTYRLPLSRAGLAEYAALEVLSNRIRGGNPYVQHASRFWDDGQRLYIVLEHCGGGNLMSLLQVEGPVDNTRMKRWTCEIASGIGFIHSAGIIHSDIRPSTILFRVNGHVCISGFEHAIVIATRQNAPPSIEERQRGLLASAREWCEAPEMLLGWEIGLEVDCWAFGIILVWMITGKKPWYHSTREHPNMIRDCILNGHFPVAPLDGVDVTVKHVITKCLDRNPLKRPTIEQIKNEYFGDVDWDKMSLGRIPDIRITLPTPDMIPDVSGDLPSTIIAPDLSISTVDTEIEIERSLPWTPARITRPVGLVSPGANTIASGQSAAFCTPLFLGRPRNPSPPSLPGSMGGRETPTLQKQQKEEQLYESFLPEMSEGDGVGLGVCVDEFGTFISEDEQGLVDDFRAEQGESPQISLQDALALPIPLLVTPRTSERELHVVSESGWTPSRLPARIFRWRGNAGAGIEQDVVINSNGEMEELPELSWHGLDVDPFRCSPPPSVPIEDRELGTGGGGTEEVFCEDVAGSRRMDTTFRWSTASLQMGVPPQTTGEQHNNAHAYTMSVAGLSALTRRIREQGRALLRKSQSLAHISFTRQRLPGLSSRSHPAPLSPLQSPVADVTTVLKGGGFGSVRRIGLGIGYSLPGPGLTPRTIFSSTSVSSPTSAPPGRSAGREDGEGTVPAGCYAGLGGGWRGKKRGATQQLQQQLGEQRERPKGADESGSEGRAACEPVPGASPCDSESVLILGNPGFGGTVALDGVKSNV